MERKYEHLSMEDRCLIQMQLSLGFRPATIAGVLERARTRTWCISMSIAMDIARSARRKLGGRSMSWWSGRIAVSGPRLGCCVSVDDGPGETERSRWKQRRLAVRNGQCNVRP